MSEPPKCGTCRHWATPVSLPYTGEVPGWGCCEVVGDYQRLAADQVKAALAMTCEDDDRSYLVTRPHFGCVLWAARVDPPPAGG